MSSGSTLATGYVDIMARTGSFDSAMSRVHAQTAGLGQAFAGIGVRAIELLASSMQRLSEQVRQAVATAASLESSYAKIGTLFGSASKEVGQFADDMATAYGTVKGETLEAVSNFGMVFKGIGMTQAESAKLGVQLTALAGDMAAMSDVPLADALFAIQAALRGESVPLRQFNVFLDAAKIEAQAAAMAFRKVNGEFTDQQKKAATLALILKGTQDQQGTMAREANQTSAMMRRLGGDFSNSASALGTKLLPAVREGIAFLYDMGAHFSYVGEAASSGLDSAVSAIVEGFQTASVILHNWRDVLEIVRLKFWEMGTNIWKVVETIPANLGAIGTWLAGNWREVIADALSAVWRVFSNFAENIKDLGTAIWEYLTNPGSEWKFEFTPLLDGFQATVKELPKLIAPELVSVQDQINEITDRMAKDAIQRSERAAAAARARQEAAKRAMPEMDALKRVGDAGFKPYQEVQLSVFSGAGDYLRAAQDAILKQEDPIAKAQLMEQQKMRQALEKIEKAGNMPAGTGILTVRPMLTL